MVTSFLPRKSGCTCPSFQGPYGTTGAGTSNMMLFYCDGRRDGYEAQKIVQVPVRMYSMRDGCDRRGGRVYDVCTPTCGLSCTSPSFSPSSFLSCFPGPLFESMVLVKRTLRDFFPSRVTYWSRLANPTCPKKHDDC